MGEIRTCPNCHKPVLDNETICPNCGAIVGDEDPNKTIAIDEAFRYESDMMIPTAPKRQAPLSAQALKAPQKRKSRSQSFTATAPKSARILDPSAIRQNRAMRLQRHNDVSAYVIIALAILGGLVILAYAVKGFSGKTGKPATWTDNTENDEPINPIEYNYAIWKKDFSNIANIKLVITTNGKQLGEGELTQIRDRLAFVLSKPNTATSILESYSNFQRWRSAGAGVTLLFYKSPIAPNSYRRYSFQVTFKQ